MCLLAIENNDNWDATNSWSGYNYQGKVALYLGLRKINYLITNNNEEYIERYSIEIEWLEDFSIIYTENGQHFYESIHQVKAKENTNIQDYGDALVKMYHKVVKNSRIQNAYLHVCRELDYEGRTWSECVEETVKKADLTKKLYQKMINYRKETKENKAKYIEKLNSSGRNTKENNLIKEYNKVYFQFKKVTLKNIDEILDKIIGDLDAQIQVSTLGIQQADLKKMALYPYSENKLYCSIIDINDLIKKEIITYWEHRGYDWKIKDKGMCENVFLYLQGVIDKHITERHLKYNKTVMRDIGLCQIIDILDSNKSIERCEEYYLYVIKQRLFSICSDYHEECKTEFDTDEERQSKCDLCEIKVFINEMTRKPWDEFKEYLHVINPDVVNNIDSEHWEKFCNEIKIKNPLFRGLRDIMKPYEKDKKFASYIGEDKKLNILTAIMHDEDTKKDAMRICGKIVTNPNLNEVLMDYDSLISRRLDMKSVFYGAGDYLESFKLEENHVYHYKNLCIKALDDVINEFGEKKNDKYNKKFVE